MAKKKSAPKKSATKAAASKSTAPQSAAPKPASRKAAPAKAAAVKTAGPKKGALKSGPKITALKQSVATAKASVKNRTLSANRMAGAKGMPGSPGQEQDVKRRMGNFEGKGEAPRKGGRTGIAGQKPSKFGTDKGKK
jgi:hypothetical protein